MFVIKVRQIKINVRNDSIDVLKEKISNKLRINVSDIRDLEIIKKSIDARDKSNVLFIYEVDVLVSNEDKVLERNKNSDVSLSTIQKYKYPESGYEELKNRPVVVGAGPCGLFCTMILAECGYKPILIERGEKVEDRLKSVNNFWETGKLNENSNVCFGEGGAGTFSDGKLNTLVNDKESRIKKVFESFVSFGAPDEIMYLNKPHIGTNVLHDVIINMRNYIINKGGDILYNTCLTDVKIVDNKVKSIVINDEKELDCDCLVLALGHSARDTIEMLYNHNLSMSSKPFAVGLRIQHKQDMISKNQYGDFYKYLPPASYKLTHQASNGRGVYTFCMCPGGFVVNSSCEKNHLIVNGMSNYERDEENANSAVVVTVNQDDFGNSPLDGLKFQRELEKKAYNLGKGKIPVQLFGDYQNNVVSDNYYTVEPLFKGDYCFSNLNDIFPLDINNSLKEGIVAMGKKIHGFDSYDSILAGVESRTSSAVRMERGDDLLSNIRGIYPAGEGAGYSGGITTSAVDGIKVAEKIIEKYSNDFFKTSL